MQNKELQFNNDARTSMLKGMEVLANAVGSTLGPNGQCVVIDDYVDEKPLITKDGVTVAKNIQLKNKFENLGVQLLKEASVRSVERVGDGTTTTVVLAYELIKRSWDLIQQHKLNPIQFKNVIQKYEEFALEELKQQAIPITESDLKKVATISANNDSEIGELISDAFQKIGLDGVITVEESPSIRTYSDIITGMQFDRGYETPFFATDPVKGNCILENCLILLTDQKIQIMRDIVPILEIAVKKSRPILIIAQDFDDEVIQNLKINKLRNIVNVCAVKAPSYGTYRSDILEDLAILTGGKVITYESGIELPKVTEEMLGQCGKIIVTKETTTIVNGKGSKEIITARVEQIKNLSEQISNELDRDFLKDFYAQRIAKLSGGICSIYVGGTTEIEMKERKDRIEDAVCATKAAIEGGIVTGGGLSFVKVSDRLLDFFDFSKELHVIATSLHAVINKIASNSGKENITELSDPNVDHIGYDAKNDVFVNMFDAGIINPAKSDILALENAFSVLNMFLTANTLIVNEEISF